MRRKGKHFVLAEEEMALVAGILQEDETFQKFKKGLLINNFLLELEGLMSGGEEPAQETEPAPEPEEEYEEIVEEKAVPQPPKPPKKKLTPQQASRQRHPRRVVKERPPRPVQRAPPKQEVPETLPPLSEAEDDSRDFTDEDF